MKLSHSHHILLLVVFVTSAFFGAGDQSAVAQSEAKKKKKKKPPQPERVLIESKDGIELRAEWYAGVDGKETPPIILVHDWDSSRTALMPLANALQQQLGCAVIVPDLRGHGESMSMKNSEDDLKRERFRKGDMASMVEDIDTCRRFLQEKNDAGELNLNLLSVIAFGKMSINAIDWCISDWSWPPIRGVQQGQNVKSLIMVSPIRRFKSMNMAQGLKHPLFASKADTMPVLMFWGDGHKASSKDGNAIFQALKKARKEPDKFEEPEEQWTQQSLFKLEYKTESNAEELLQSDGRDMLRMISMFIEKKVLANSDEFDWQVRSLKK